MPHPLIAHRGGDIVTVSLHHPHYELSLLVDLAAYHHPLRAVAGLMVEHGFVSADLVRRTARSATRRTPYLELKPDEQALIDVFVALNWCRVRDTPLVGEPKTDA